jgi:hypothetical protein
MPLVRNPSGIVVSVPDDHWALTDPEFVLLPNPEPVVERASSTKSAPAKRRAPKK